MTCAPDGTFGTYSKIGSKVILAGAKMETSLPQIPLQNAATYGQSKQKQIN